MIVIGVPTTGSIPIEVVGCIQNVILNRKDVFPYYIKGSLVYDARSKVVNYALKNNADLLFLDSDIIFPLEGFDRLIAHDADIVSGLYFGRVPGAQPIAYKTVRPKTLLRKEKIEGIDLESTNNYYFEVEGAGLGFCFIRNRVLHKLTKQNVNPFEPFGNLGEDFSFFVRCRRAGFRIMLDTTFELRHIGEHQYTRADYREEG